MRGGKREGAGRKPSEKTKSYRLPIALEPQIMELVKRHKEQLLIPVTESKERVKPRTDTPTKEQIKRLQIWLHLHGYAKSPNEARKMTATNQLVKESVLKYFENAGEKYNWTIGDLNEMYART